MGKRELRVTTLTCPCTCRRQDALALALAGEWTELRVELLWQPVDSVCGSELLAPMYQSVSLRIKPRAHPRWRPQADRPSLASSHRPSRRSPSQPTDPVSAVLEDLRALSLKFHALSDIASSTGKVGSRTPHLPRLFFPLALSCHRRSHQPTLLVPRLHPNTDLLSFALPPSYRLINDRRCVLPPTSSLGFCPRSSQPTVPASGSPPPALETSTLGSLRLPPPPLPSAADKTMEQQRLGRRLWMRSRRTSATQRRASCRVAPV